MTKRSKKELKKYLRRFSFGPFRLKIDDPPDDDPPDPESTKKD